METALLQTKLYIPPPRSELIPRPRLIERLNESLCQNQGQGFRRKLTLISAPAGFGKTTLVSEWVTAGEQPAAWLSLDDGDNDPARFLAYLVTALQTIAPKIGEGVLGVLQSPQPPPIESILTTLLNEITTIPDNFILILDDYHVIEAQPVDASTRQRMLTDVDEALTFLLDHLPPQMHLVIATREDPQLPLARYRVRSQLTELRVADLRFSSAEAAEFLNQAMGLNLSEENIAALETRTEGWIAGLQLAALALQGTLSLRGREDVSEFIKAFAGDNRYIVDYLVEEVLQRQPERVRSFLLQTSILDRLNGSLCDAVCAVTGQEDGRGMLKALERGNLFVVPLDDKRHWFRYHHLFADVLQARLLEEQPDKIPILHRRASEWYERNNFPSDAIRHAIAARDFERAADLAELVWPAWSGSFQSIAWLGWVKTLPDELVRARPVLCVAYAWAFLNAGELEAAEARLRDAERWLEPTIDMRPEDPLAETCPFDKLRADSERSRRMMVVDEEQFRSLPITLATARAYHAQAIGDVAGTVTYARRVLDLSPEGDPQRGDATALLGLAYWASGDLEAAHRTLSDSLAGMKPLEIIVGTFVLAEMKMVLGQLREAISTCEHALRLAAKHGEPLPIGTEDVYTGMSELHREQGNLEAAAQDLATSKKLGDQVELPDWQYRWCIAQARLKETLGDLDGSLDLLDEAERLYVRTPLPKVRPIAAMKARVWIRQGKLNKALGWVRERDLSVDNDPSYLHEFEHITLVRLLIAEYRSDRTDRSILEAMEFLERLLQAAEDGRRMGSVIEILVLQALAHEAKDDIPSALAPLERALILAEPEGYVRIFVDEGQPMAELLKRMKDDALLCKGGRMNEYIHKLLAAFGQKEKIHPSSLATQGVIPQSLVEPLSQRELEVLQLIAQGLSNREISEQLFLALDTVKGHNRRIYGKLQVQRRTEAVACARELGLL